jgi:type I restriction enzyme M protein
MGLLRRTARRHGRHSQYKDYVLTMLFMKYVSDKYIGDPYGMNVVPPGPSFADMVNLKGDKEIGEKINKIIEVTIC